LADYAAVPPVDSPVVDAPAVIIPPEVAPAISPDVDQKKIVDQACDEVRHWEQTVARHLEDFNTFASTWRLDIPTRGRDLGMYSNTRTSETTRATETLATMMFRMITSQDPNFALYPLRDDVTEQHLYQNESVIRSQMRRLFYRRKLLKSLRGLCLFGTQIVEQPWHMEVGNGETYFEGTDFIPRSLLQFAFDPSVPDIKLSDFHTVMDFVSASRLRLIAKSSPGVWDAEVIERAITECKDVSQVNQRVRDRLSKAGYQITDAKTLLITTRWGVDENGVEGVATILNEKHLARFHPIPFASGKRPFLISSMIDFELEPYGYGVGNMGKRVQSELDANRNRNNDLMTFSQFNMWKVARSAGLRSKDLRIRPFKVVELDSIDSLEALRPDLSGLQAGLQHEERLREDFRAVTGATNNLQAVDSAATATEASLTQNEAVRRVAVLSEVIGEEFVREHVDTCLKNNAQLLDRPLWVSMTGEDAPMMVSPSQLRKAIGVESRITTDKDFRPERTRRMIELLSTLTSIRQQIPGNVDVLPLVQEVIRSVGINPKKVVKPLTALDKIKAAMAQSQAMSGQVPADPREAVAAGMMRGDLQEPQMDPGSVPMTPGGEGGNLGAISTPIGDVAASPGGAIG
jgi:hypothetical protein